MMMTILSLMISRHLLILDHPSGVNHMVDMSPHSNPHLTMDTFSGVYQDAGVHKVDNVSGVR